MSRIRCVTMIAGALAVALGPALALAAPTLYQIAPLAGETHSQGRAITPDGRYVTGVSNSNSSGSTMGTGILWDITNPTATVKVRDVPGNVANVGTGIGYYTANSQQLLVIHAAASANRDAYWITGDGGTTFTRNRTNDQVAAASPLAGMGGANTLAVNSGGNAFYGAFNKSNLEVFGVRGTGYTPPPTLQSVIKSTTEEAQTKAVAGASPVTNGEFRVVGYRKNAGGASRVYVLDYNNTATSIGNFYSVGLQGNDLGELWAVDASGTRAGGWSPHPTKSGNWPFILDNPVSGGGTATELPTLNPSGSAASLVYGISPDGDYAVGRDFTMGHDRAVLWDISDPNPANWTILDLSQFASDNGLLGAEWTSGVNNNALQRAFSVGVNAQGQPVITGYGAGQGQTRGFVITLPEPATLSLLALGGLTLLMRRRR